MMLPPADPAAGSAAGSRAPGPVRGADQTMDPDLALILAGAEELPAEEELAGLVALTEEDLAVLDARLAAELARLRDPGAAGRDGSGDWRPDPGGDPAGGPAALSGGGFAGGGVLDQLGPGPALAGFSQGALDEGLGGLSDDELAGVLRASRRLAAWQDGIEITAVAELDARRARAAARVSSAVDDQVSPELAAALVLTGRSAGSLLGLARDLARLPAVRTARACGGTSACSSA
jgi:hypothetical protein